MPRRLWHLGLGTVHCAADGREGGIVTIGKDLAVSGYLVHLMGCALSGREPDNLPDGCSWDDVVSRARENSILGLVWRAARELDGIPDDLRASCERHSRMLALHNVRYEAERVAVCEALHKAGLSTLTLKGASLVPRYPDYSMREVGGQRRPVWRRCARHCGVLSRRCR